MNSSAVAACTRAEKSPCRKNGADGVAPDVCRIGSPRHQPLLARSPLESKEGTPTFGNAGLSSATPRGSAVTGPGKLVRSQPKATDIKRATPNHRLEEHGCRPRSPGRDSTSWGSSGAGCGGRVDCELVTKSRRRSAGKTSSNAPASSSISRLWRKLLVTA